MNISNFIRDWCTDLYGQPPNSFQRMVYYKILRKFGFTGRRFDSDLEGLLTTISDFEDIDADDEEFGLFCRILIMSLEEHGLRDRPHCVRPTCDRYERFYKTFIDMVQPSPPDQADMFRHKLWFMLQRTGFFDGAGHTCFTAFIGLLTQYADVNPEIIGALKMALKQSGLIQPPLKPSGPHKIRLRLKPELRKPKTYFDYLDEYCRQMIYKEVYNNVVREFRQKYDFLRHLNNTLILVHCEFHGKPDHCHWKHECQYVRYLCQVGFEEKTYWASINVVDTVQFELDNPDEYLRKGNEPIFKWFLRSQDEDEVIPKSDFYGDLSNVFA